MYQLFHLSWSFSSSVQFEQASPVAASLGNFHLSCHAYKMFALCRYGLPVVIVVFNNNGIYGGDRRAKELAAAATAGATAHGFASDPSPTDFVPNARYQMVMEAFGGRGYQVDTAEQLRVVCVEAFNSRRPALVNITIDPMAGVESGNVHAFNAPKSKL